MAEPRKILITNKLRQGLPILLTNGKGQMQSWILPAKGHRNPDGTEAWHREIFESELSQDVADKETRGYISLSFLGTTSVPAMGTK